MTFNRPRRLSSVRATYHGARRCRSRRTDLEPVLEKQDARVHHRRLDSRSHLKETLGLVWGAEAHDPFDTGPVVPTPVEDDDLASRRQVRDVPLDVHLRLLALGRSRQGYDAENRRAHAIRYRLDRAAPAVQRFDFWIAIAAIAGTLLLGVLAGVMIGIGLSLVWLTSVATRPPMPVLGRDPDTQFFRELDGKPLRRAVPSGAPAGRRPVLHNLGCPRGPRPRGRIVDARHQRDRARLRGHRLHRLPGVGEDARDPRAHGTSRCDAAPCPGEAGRPSSARA
jgi:hypothetical protein